MAVKYIAIQYGILAGDGMYLYMKEKCKPFGSTYRVWEKKDYFREVKHLRKVWL
jgi:hypothetical protein